MTQETPKRETRIKQQSRISSSKNIPERYCKGTGKVLNSGGKGTVEVLESYQRGTKKVPTGSKTVVALERNGSALSRHCDRNEMEREASEGLIVDNLLDRLLPHDVLQDSEYALRS